MSGKRPSRASRAPKPQRAPGLPTKDEILAFVEQAGEKVGKREIEDVPLIETQPRHAERGLIPLAAPDELIPDQV